MEPSINTLITDHSESFAERFIASRSVQAVVERDGAFLLEIDDGLCFLLNSLGTIVWNALDAPRTLGELVSTVHARHADVDRAIIERDVTAFLQALAANNLVKRVDQ